MSESSSGGPVQPSLRDTIALKASHLCAFNLPEVVQFALRLLIVIGLELLVC
jgi:hypothetical protein